jgi:hypothetical protein
VKPEKETCIAWSYSPCSCYYLVHAKNTIPETEQQKFPISCLCVLDNDGDFNVIEKNTLVGNCEKVEVFVAYIGFEVLAAVVLKLTSSGIKSRVVIYGLHVAISQQMEISEYLLLSG